MEFYYLRHGMVDYGPNHQLDHAPDVPLNEEGRLQATRVRPVIESLPIKTICVSPLLRAKETKDLVAANLDLPVVEIEELRECNDTTWLKMSALDTMSNPYEVEQFVHDFMNRAVIGIQKALTFPGPVLVVAHGGIHWAFCHQLQVDHPSKRLSHCVPVHFRHTANRWHASLIH